MSEISTFWLVALLVIALGVKLGSVSWLPWWTATKHKSRRVVDALKRGDDDGVD